MANFSDSSPVTPLQSTCIRTLNFKNARNPFKKTDSRNPFKKSTRRRKICGKKSFLVWEGNPLPHDKEDDAALDWLLIVNGDFFERIDVSLDQFERLRTNEEGSGGRMMKVEEKGFQMVYEKNNNKLFEHVWLQWSEEWVHDHTSSVEALGF